VAASSAAPRLSLPKAWGWQSSNNPPHLFTRRQHGGAYLARAVSLRGHPDYRPPRLVAPSAAHPCHPERSAAKSRGLLEIVIAGLLKPDDAIAENI